ncbi:MAG: 4Fe-4S dicluster domain-containing protein [Thermoflexus sp.]
MAEPSEKVAYDRRDLLVKLASAVFAGLVAPAVVGEPAPAEAVTLPELPQLPPPQPGEDPLVRMMRDLQRALQKPVEQRRWAMVIDLRKCVGCHACTISCVVENKLPPGVVYRPVLEEEIGTYPHVTRRFIPRPCMQCERPPCVPVCPVNATWKRPDGIVVIDYDQCIGCRYCITACPYGARTFDFGDRYTEGTPPARAFLVGEEGAAVHETIPMFEYGQPRPRHDEASPVGNTRKCHFCLHRIERGLLPECVVTCIGRATYFGDANDPESLVSELIAQPNVMRLKEELGTEPKVYYLL